VSAVLQPPANRATSEPSQGIHQRLLSKKLPSAARRPLVLCPWTRVSRAAHATRNMTLRVDGRKKRDVLLKQPVLHRELLADRSLTADRETTSEESPNGFCVLWFVRLPAEPADRQGGRGLARNVPTGFQSFAAAPPPCPPCCSRESAPPPALAAAAVKRRRTARGERRAARTVRASEATSALLPRAPFPSLLCLLAPPIAVAAAAATGSSSLRLPVACQCQCQCQCQCLTRVSSPGNGGKEGREQRAGDTQDTRSGQRTRRALLKRKRKPKNPKFLRELSQRRHSFGRLAHVWALRLGVRREFKIGKHDMRVQLGAHTRDTHKQRN
jgi:hypothetical protein